MMNEQALVTVIMPVYNGEAFLAEAIDSVLRQSYPAWELVVVDDGSNDRSAEIIRSYADPRIRYTYQENRGQAVALNRGLELARGTFITTLDADDVYPSHSLADRVEYLATHPDYGAVYGDGYYCRESGEPFLRFSEHMPAGVSGDVFDTLIVSPFYGTGASVMIRNEALQRQALRYDESIVWCQDWDFYIRLSAGTQIGFVSSIMIHYRLHGSGMTVAMPQGQRLGSLLRLRQRVMKLSRFQTVGDSQKAAFFYDFVVNELHGQTEKQAQVFDDPAFRELSQREQSRLIRLAARRYAAAGQQTIVKAWQQMAWLRSPLNARSAMMALAWFLSPRLAQRVSQQREERMAERAMTPFAIVAPSD
jgi:glycosyltransferase involved in cell wall biosynthesis